jgi:hypothetical protein
MKYSHAVDFYHSCLQAFYCTKYKYLVKNGGTSGNFWKGYFEKPGPQKTWLRNSLKQGKGTYLFGAVKTRDGKRDGIFFLLQCGKQAEIKKVQRPLPSVCLRSGVGFFRAESVQCGSSSWSSFVSFTENRNRRTPVWEGMRTG